MEMFFVTLMVILMAFFIWLWRRNNRTRDMLNTLNKMKYEWSIDHLHEESAYDWCAISSDDYGRILWSFRPVKLKYWVPQDQLEKLLDQ